MNKYFIVVVLCLAGNIGLADNPSWITRGTLDLRQWDDSQPVITLNGPWAFYWEELLTAKDLSTAIPEYAEVSIPWSEQVINGNSYPRNGYATYVLRIKTPPHIQKISLWIPAVFNSSSVWINDSLVVSSGVVGKHESLMTPLWKPHALTVAVPSSDFYLCLQIANFQGTRGGCAEIPKLGKADILSEKYSRDIVLEKVLIALFAIIVFIGVITFYTMGVKSYLGLGLVALAFIIRFMFSDLYMIYHLGGHFPWFVTIRIEYCSIPMIIMGASYFIHLIYPIEFGRRRSLLFCYISIAEILIVLSLPTRLLTEALVGLQLTGLAFSTMILLSIIMAIRRQRRGAWLSAFSFFCFAAVGFYNIYTFLFPMDLNRYVIISGYGTALLLSAISLNLRTPVRLRQEQLDMLRYEDFYQTEKD